MKITLTAPKARFTFASLLLLVLTSMALTLPGCEEIEEILEDRARPQTGGAPLDLQLVADSLASPLGVVAVPDQTNRLFVIDQVGKVWVIDQNGRKLSRPFIDVSSKMVPLSPNYDERGLLGLAFHPQYAQNGRFFIYYTLPPRAGGPTPTTTWNNLSRISEFRVSSSNPNQADMGTERVILQLDDPQTNHNGGTIAFGPDGYLYIAIGDGGGANDVAPGHVEDWYKANAGGNGQDIEANLFGDILRLDVDRGAPYAIPRDNPLVGRPGRDEIYAYGFRNPYRFSFDMAGGRQLFVGDAGQLLYEEVSIVKSGGNYGWNVKEGTHCFDAANPLQELSNCPTVDAYGVPLSDPVIEMNNYRNPKGGRATTIIGGNVYRGITLPGYHGKYFFGTFSQGPGTPNGELFMATPMGERSLWSYQEVNLKGRPNDLGYYLKGFGQDNQGELYLTVSSLTGPTGTTGKVYKLVPGWRR
ncbi:PQQ-dependent sugar dehydrogenase [Rufibacter immobilis]|uniref:PQQ-dependent sugar dehydrogenase n=1 Tax=Rufibacter immobilis TaxID=1348778 RepID=UPI0035E69313